MTDAWAVEARRHIEFEAELATVPDLICEVTKQISATLLTQEIEFGDAVRRMGLGYDVSLPDQFEWHREGDKYVFTVTRKLRIRKEPDESAPTDPGREPQSAESGDLHVPDQVPT